MEQKELEMIKEIREGKAAIEIEKGKKGGISYRVKVPGDTVDEAYDNAVRVFNKLKELFG